MRINSKAKGMNFLRVKMKAKLELGLIMWKSFLNWLIWLLKLKAKRLTKSE